MFEAESVRISVLVGGVGDHRGLLRDQRLQRVADRVGVDVAQRHQPRDETVAVRRPRCSLRTVSMLVLLGVAHRHDLEHAAGRRHGREALHLRASTRRPRRPGRPVTGVGRDDRDAAAHAVVVQVVLAGRLGDRADHLGDARRPGSRGDQSPRPASPAGGAAPWPAELREAGSRSQSASAMARSAASGDSIAASPASRLHALVLVHFSAG